MRAEQERKRQEVEAERQRQPDVWIFDFSDQKLNIFRSKKRILFVLKVFEGHT